MSEILPTINIPPDLDPKPPQPVAPKINVPSTQLSPIEKFDQPASSLNNSHISARQVLIASADASRDKGKIRVEIAPDEPITQWFGSDSGLPKTLVEAPTSTVRFRFKESDHAHTIEARDGILTCEVNPFAQKSLDINYRALASEQFFLDHAVLTGIMHHPPSETGYRVSSKSFGRVLPVLYGKIPYARMIGGLVIQKGGGISGWKINIRTDDKVPVGFFGKKDAQREMEISNALIERGFRSSLILGYAELNPEWILSQIQDKKMKNRVNESLGILKENGNVPVIMFRVDGTTERYATAGDFMFSPARFRAELARGSQLLLHEAQRKGSLTEEYLADLGANKNRVIATLSKLGQRKTLSEQESILFQQLYVSITARNVSALKNYSNGSETLFPFMFDYVGKDIDLAHFAKDFEMDEQGVQASDVVTKYYKYNLF